MSIEMSSSSYLLSKTNEPELSKAQIEKNLSGLFFTNKDLSLKKVLLLAKDSYFAEVKKAPWVTLAKSILSLAGLCAIYPTFIGSWACLKTFQITPLKDLESKNLEVAMTASQNIGNTGMGITNFVPFYEFTLLPITLLFKRTYNQKVCELIKSHYNHVFQTNNLSEEEKKYLIERENRQLAAYHGRPNSRLLDLQGVQGNIDKSLNRHLSLRNIVHLTVQQIKKDLNHASCSTILKKTALTITAIGFLGFCGAVLSLGTYGCYKPFALQSAFDLASSNSQKVEDAVANYANAGHGLEYLGVMGTLTYKVLMFLVRNQYQKVVEEQIRNAYESSTQNSNYSKKIRDTLHDRMLFDLTLLF